MHYRYIKQMLLAGIALLIAGCGGGGKDGTLSYFMLGPKDTAVLTTDQPTFRFERNTNNTSAALACDTSNTDINFAKLQVIKIDPQTTNITTVLEKTITLPNDCQFSVNFPSLTLEENIGYAWHVGEVDELLGEDSKWHGFIYSTQSMGIEDKNPHSCENNLLSDWTFTDKQTPWHTTNMSSFTPQTAANIVMHGDEDNGSAALATPTALIYQSLDHPIIQGKYYQLKLSIKHEGKSDFQIKALAFNGILNRIQPDSNTSLIGMTGTMTYQGHWIKIILNPWKANKDFSNLAIVLFNDDNMSINARIDRVCFTEVNEGGCGDAVETTSNTPEDFDINQSNPVITNFEYLLGSVSDLYPDANTSNAEWFLEDNSSTLACTTIGEDSYSPDVLDEFAAQEANESSNEVVQNELEEWITEHNDSTDFPLEDRNLTMIPPINNDKCTDRIVDPSKPFSGRDIVFVHGLQKDAIDDLKRMPWRKRYHGRWPYNPGEFSSHGAYYQEALPYWRGHIVDNLGSMTHPSNSYMIVTWSALQRAQIGINAILHEIQSARAGNHDLVQLSDNAKAHNQCFGDNGIVFVTHSTGGMLISMMFGDMEKHKNDPNYYNFIPSNLQNLFDAQVGFDAAYGGSEVATAGLATTHSILYPNQAHKSILVDLGVPSITKLNQAIMDFGQKPTFMLIGAEAGKNKGGPKTGGRIFIKGYNDTVVSSWSQSAHRFIRPKYKINTSKKRKLYDKGSSRHKAVHMIRRGKFQTNEPHRWYYVSAAFSPSGMLQDTVFAGYLHPRAYLNNHYPIIQTTGDHYDNVNLIDRNGVDYYKPKNTATFNNEETSVVMHPSLYSNGYLSNSFQTLQQVWVKKETWGFNFIKLTWVYKKFLGATFKIPKMTWHYYEYIKWKRTYHLLKDYKTKRGADYMYQYLLRP